MEADSNKQDLDGYLQWLAINEWETFKKLVGEDAIVAAKVCIMKKRGFSLGQISNRLKSQKWIVRYINDEKCKCG